MTWPACLCGTPCGFSRGDVGGAKARWPCGEQGEGSGTARAGNAGKACVTREGSSGRERGCGPGTQAPPAGLS